MGIDKAGVVTGKELQRSGVPLEYLHAVSPFRGCSCSAETGAATAYDCHFRIVPFRLLWESRRRDQVDRSHLLVVDAQSPLEVTNRENAASGAVRHGYFHVLDDVPRHTAPWSLASCRCGNAGTDARVEIQDQIPRRSSRSALRPPRAVVGESLAPSPRRTRQIARPRRRG